MVWEEMFITQEGVSGLTSKLGYLHIELIKRSWFARLARFLKLRLLVPRAVLYIGYDGSSAIAVFQILIFKLPRGI